MNAPPAGDLSLITICAALLAGCVMILIGAIATEAGSPDWVIALAWTWAFIESGPCTLGPRWTTIGVVFEDLRQCPPS